HLSRNAPPTTEFPTLSLHDALPISVSHRTRAGRRRRRRRQPLPDRRGRGEPSSCQTGVNAADRDATNLGSARARPRHLRLDLVRSEEHTSELQSRENLVCRLLLEKK